MRTLDLGNSVENVNYTFVKSRNLGLLSDKSTHCKNKSQKNDNTFLCLGFLLFGEKGEAAPLELHVDFPASS